MSLGSDLLTLQNFVNSKFTSNNTRAITGAQLNSALTQLLNIVSGVITLASITRIEHTIVSGEIVSGKSIFTLSALVGANIFLVASQSSIYFPIDNLESISPTDSNVYYSFDATTGTVSTLDFGAGITLNIYYRPGG